MTNHLFRTGLLALTVLAGCAKGDVPANSIETARFAADLKVDLSAMTKTASGLYYRDLEPGTGTTVAAGQAVAMRYAGWLPDGKQFDAAGPNDSPYVFHPGAGEVIGGWDEGVIGMKVGGKRQLVIPSALGYGAGGSGPIPPNAILVFIVEAVSAH